MSPKITLNNCCLVCNDKKIHYNFSVDKFRVEECISCGLMRLNPQPTDHELAEIYSSKYFIACDDNSDQSHMSVLKSATAEHYLNLLESYSALL